MKIIAKINTYIENNPKIIKNFLDFSVLILLIEFFLKLINNNF